MSGPASVIIPAHDEERSLPAALHTLLSGVAADEVEVVVVANGCSDATAAIAREAGAECAAPVTVIEVATASKTYAMNAGDEVATGFPRVYLDADVQCRPGTLRSLVEVLRDGRAELAVPTRRLDLESASWWVRQYYRTWQRLPRVAAELSGRGAYAFSQTGRTRFTRFPAITADDFWAVRQVPPDRAVVIPEEILIRPPRDLGSLVRVRSRVYGANRAAGVSSGRHSGTADLSALLEDPRRWVGAAVFLSTNAYVKLIGVRRQRSYGRDTARGTGGPARRAARSVPE